MHISNRWPIHKFLSRNYFSRKPQTNPILYGIHVLHIPNAVQNSCRRLIEEYIFSRVKYLRYVMKGQVVVPTLSDVRISESDTGIKSDTASNVDAWLVREQSLKVIIIFITAITHCQLCNSIFCKVCITSLSKLSKLKNK